MALDRHGESKLVVSSDSSSQSLWFLVCSPYAILVSRHARARESVYEFSSFWTHATFARTRMLDYIYIYILICTATTIHVQIRLLRTLQLSSTTHEYEEQRDAWCKGKNREGAERGDRGARQSQAGRVAATG